MNNQLWKTQKISLLFSSLITFLISYLVFAWQEPTLPPPQGNIPAPLNVSIQAQAKEGALILGNNPSVTTGLIVRYGNVGIGTTTPAYKLDIVGNLSLNSNLLLFARVHNATSAPVTCNSTKIGFIYYKTSTPEGLCICKSTGWSCFGDSGTGYTLSVYKSGTGSGTVTSSPSGINCGDTCLATFSPGTQVTLTATPSSSSTFTGWFGDCSGTDSCTLTMDSNKTVVANFDGNWTPGSMFFRRATIDTYSGGSSIFVLDATTSFIAYSDYNPSRYAYDLRFGKSTDQGGTFSISTIDTTNYTVAVAVKALNQNIVFVAYVQRDTTTGERRYWKFARSNDGGITWSLRKTIESIDYAAQYDGISMAVFDANNIAVIYNKYNQGLRLAKTSDGGLNWTIRTVDQGAFIVYEKSMDEVGNYAFAAYYDSSNGDLKFLKTTNAFNSWSVGRVDEIGNVGLGASLSAVDENTIFIAYGTYQSGARDLKLAKSLNGGTNWQISTIISNNLSGGIDKVKISLKAINANNIIFAFNARSRSESYNYLRLAISNDGGNSGVIYNVEPDDQGVHSLSIDALSSSNIYILYSWGSSYNLKLARNF